MANRTLRCLLMLMLMLLPIFSCLPNVAAAQDVNRLAYHVKYTTGHLATPSDWYNSSFFNNPDYKENRFVQYWVENPIPPGGTRDTGFYIVYNEDGIYIFFQSNEPERETNGVLKNSSIEFFLQTGLDGVPYHQMIVPTNDSPIEYYEWQTENRNNRPLNGNVTVTNEEIPTGWGTVVMIPWETYYDDVPLNGEDWMFSMIRWAPSGFSPTWGGHVHQVGRFNTLDFQAPTEEQRIAIQKNIIRKAWNKFNETASQLDTTWLNGDSDDDNFYHRYLQPLIAQGRANGSNIPNLDHMNAAEIDVLYQHVNSWFELRYDAEDLRESYIQGLLFRENEPPTVTNATYTTLVNTPVSGIVVGTDPDGDPLTYSLGAAPAHGAVNVSADGNWTYTPNQNYTGRDQFQVIVTDLAGDTATSTIDLTITSGPMTTVALDPPSPNGSNGWYTSDVTVTMATYSDSIGVNRTEYRINNGDWLVYSAPFTIAEEGVHVVEYRGIDNAGNVEKPQSIQLKIDKTPPTIALTLDKTVLSPPNHKMVPIEVTITNSDQFSGISSFELTSITSNEDDNNLGDGNTSNDIQDAAYGTPDTSFKLRAERSGRGTGRVYTVTYTVFDHAGLSSSVSATVTVPKGN
ncbi:Ig-like domain-containing protein [Paenibacillus terrigena]|uniref:Ig-like domain-containing protein n=1 Tax=Paenibacillus terrigena TaxID=369333 RepID=UPI00035C1C9B|nr:Ig-like domain-containing protein [Paenibacillus terrigena]